MKKIITVLLFISLAAISFSQNDFHVTDSVLHNKAVELSKSFVIVDSHIDLPDWLYDEWFDVSKESKIGEIDYPRARKGGLDVAFMSIYTSPRLERTGKSKVKADSMMNLVHKMVKTWPDKFCFINSTAEIKNNLNQNKILLTMGMENGSPIENNLDNVKEFYDKGVRYITLAHYKCESYL